MVNVLSKATGKSVGIQRILGELDYGKPGPTVIITAGIHGNEPAGVFAALNVLSEFESNQTPVQGRVVALAGNLTALGAGKRYFSSDLNRVWQLNGESKTLTFPEKEEKDDLLDVLKQELNRSSGPFIFLDLHTTSSRTIPFITINDSLTNRDFSKNIPVPIILGIEEYLNGPLLSFINELGHTAIGFESGQHDAEEAIENAEAFLHLALCSAGCVPCKAQKCMALQKSLAKSAEGLSRFYEIIYRHEIELGDRFLMNPGFQNFENIEAGQALAIFFDNPVLSPMEGAIFMPLYQSQGEEGFFIIRRIPIFYLKLSRWMRRMGLHRILAFMPGVSWKENSRTTLVIRKSVARFFRKKLLHLLGYRSRKETSTHLEVTHREIKNPISI